jgi:hypothetical protein
VYLANEKLFASMESWKLDMNEIIQILERVCNNAGMLLLSTLF